MKALVAPLSSVFLRKPCFLERLAGPASKTGIVLVGASANAKDRMALAQMACLGKATKRREKLAARQVSRRAEDNEEMGRNAIGGHG